MPRRRRRGTLVPVNADPPTLHIPVRPRPGLTFSVLAGPSEAACSVLPGGSVAIGRARACELCFPFPDVSRKHAAVVAQATGWYVIDQGSLSGTFVNGVRIAARTPIALSSGDSLRIGPCVLRVGLGSGVSPTATIDDTGGGAGRSGGVARVADARPLPAADRRLRLLTDCLSVLTGAADERALAELALQAVLAESGYSRGALLRRIDGGHSVEVVGELRRGPDDRAPFVFSRSLVQRAAGGSVAILASDRVPAFGESIVDLRIHSALCAPVVIGGEVEGYLYLDARGHESSVRAEADGFCDAVAKACGLALANLKRADLERRRSSLQAELDAAREAQQFILPPPAADLGFLRYAMEMRAGVIVAGDLFDCVPLPDGRVAIAIGDVSGHGAGSAMVMAAIQAHLHAEIVATGDPALAVKGANRYLAAHARSEHFVTLWLGVFAPDGELLVVDAGHGYWAIKPAGGGAATPNVGGAIPVGIDAETTYHDEAFTLAPGDRVILFSDGMVEQRGESGQRFGRQALLEALAGDTPEDDVRAAFDAVVEFSAGAALTDDATAASVEYRGA